MMKLLTSFPIRIQLIFLIFICSLSCNSDDIQVLRNEIVQTDPDFKNWSHYLGDPARTHYSVLNEIDTANVHLLKPVWQYESGTIDSESRSQIQTNPLIINDILYGITPKNSLFAIKADTGKYLWQFNPELEDESGLGLSRGVSVWIDKKAQKGRLFYASGYTLFAIDMESGKLIPEFGEQGRIDLRRGLDRDPNTIPMVLTTPGAVYKDLLILGGRTSESPGAAPGHIRAYDVKTGKMEWIFHTIPYPGEFGYDTWPSEAYKSSGGANSWAGMALDKKRGIVYVPTGSAAFDWYGGDRIGDNLFANCLIALDAETGERIWHFQMVKHDLWDRDLPAPPNLFEVERGGELVPAVAQITKSGHVFVFNRLTGEPLFPLEEKSYPNTPLEGDIAAATQVLPLKPIPFARQILKEEDLYAPEQLAYVDDFIDNAQNLTPPTVREKLAQVTSAGQFIPIDTRGVILYPGADGGGEWGGAALDPTTGIMYVNSNEMAWIVRMAKLGEKDGKPLSEGETLTQIHCVRCHGAALQGMGEIPALQNIKMKLDTAAIKGVISKGKGAMPAMPNLSEREISQIGAFLTGMEEEKTNEEEHRVEKQIKSRYAMVGFGRFKDSRGYPVMKPPWGTLNAIDLNSGEYLWTIALGHEESLNDPEYPVSGLENYGGPVITAGGILFIAATKDEKFRAFHMRSGKLLWETDLPAGGYATPATYEVNGKQYVVIACGGGKMGTKSGATYVSFALP
ncbi:PQQ-binding-like beta-propeller repeat protein [Muriicola sp. E247]|uniref:outer membrane protein assembly factor BamB family protein n=1 Tax=Muriicola sp. E247 TaxID=3242730 RepID=UPI0035259473